MRLAPRPPSTSLVAALRAAAIAMLLALPMVGCVVNTSSGNGGNQDAATVDAPAIETVTVPPPVEQPVSNPSLSNEAVPAPTGDAPGEVDYACTTDADCAVKDVGSCCGYAPACVNKDSPTFPEQVKAECAKNDMQSTCGFRDIEGCACVAGRCEAGPTRSGEVVR